ncbi:MAG: putative signal transducing protein [Myxococcota bacterium]
MLKPRQSGLAVVGRFFYLHEADLAKALLESYGIEAWVLDQHLVRMEWHLAGALGGVKLAVAEENAYRARQVLEDDYSEVLDEIEEQQLPAHADECCPRCGSGDTRSRERRAMPGPFQWLVSAAFFLGLGVLVPRRRLRIARECRACGYHWAAEEAR